LQFNPLPYAAGHESKYGGWANSPPNGTDSQAVYDYGYNQLDFLVLGDVKRQILYNNFHFGSQRGMVLTEENGQGPSGISLGLGVDAAKYAVVIEATAPEGFEFINSQLVTVGTAEDNRYIETGVDFKGEVTFYNSDSWGAPTQSIVLMGGTLNLMLAHFESAGKKGFSILQDGELRIENSIIRSANPLFNKGKEPQVTVHSSIADTLGINWRDNPLWEKNLANIMIAAPVSQSSVAVATPEPIPVDSSDITDDKDSTSKGISPLILIITAIIAALVLGLGIILYKRNKRKEN